MNWSFLKSLILTTFALVAYGQRLREQYESHDISKCPAENYSCCLITHCVSAWTLLNAGVRPKICGWNNETPLVCCPRYVHQEELHDDGDLFLAEDESPATEVEPENIEEETLPSMDRKLSSVEAVIPQPNVESTPLKVSDSSAGNCGIREVDPSSDIPESAIRNFASESPTTARPPEIVVGGGTPVNQKWSWMVGIYNRNAQRPFCGATVIDDKHILTAAHCFDLKGIDASQYTVKIGEVDLLKSNPSYEIEEIKTHENYQPRLYYDDIAIIRLKERIPDGIVTICVPEEDNLNHGDNVTGLSWGQLAFGGRSTSTLQEAHGIPIVRNRDCNSSYEKSPSNQFPKGITENMICAGHEKGGVDSCRGNSGGPLLREYMKNNWALVGIISFGFRCAEPGFPGVYTRVSSYLPWIRNYVDAFSEIDFPMPISLPYKPVAFLPAK